MGTLRVRVLAIIYAFLIVIAASIVGGPVWAAASMPFAITVLVAALTTPDTVIEARRESVRSKLAKLYASSLGGRMRAQLNLVDTIVDIIVAAMIIAALWSSLDQALSNLVHAAQCSSNPLISALAPALPYVIGLVLLSLIWYLVRWARDRINPGR